MARSWWRYAYRFGGKQKVLAIGAYPIVSLAEARRRREDAHRLISKGIDPMEQRRRDRADARAIENTLGKVATEYVEKRQRDGLSETTISKKRWLLSLVSSELSAKPLREVRPSDLLADLRAIERRGRHETAHRLRALFGEVFRYAIASDRAENDPASALRGALQSRSPTNHAAITNPNRVGELLRAIDDFSGQPTTKAALELLALLFPRPGELRHARWDEVKLDQAIWIIPAGRTKMRREHRVPLPRQAVCVISGLQPVSGRSELLFPSLRSFARPISENTLNAALRRLGYAKEEMTSHGFRATASTLLNESGRWSPDAIERALAHLEGNAVRRAYARGEYWEERVRMAQWWADYIDKLRAAKLDSRSL